MSGTVIGGLNEKSLHRQLKKRYTTGESLVEEKVAGYIIDVVNPDELIEIQTANFSGMKNKLAALLPAHPVRLVHPVAAETMITVYNRDGTERSRRRSPKRGSFCSAAGQLLYITDHLPDPNLTIEVLLIKQEEIRYDDGRGARRRRGISIEDRLLCEVVEKRQFSAAGDYLDLLPPGLPSPFGNRELAEHLPSTGTGSRGKLRTAGQLTYLLRRLGLIVISGKDGKRMLFEFAAGTT